MRGSSRAHPRAVSHLGAVHFSPSLTGTTYAVSTVFSLFNVMIIHSVERTVRVLIIPRSLLHRGSCNLVCTRCIAGYVQRSMPVSSTLAVPVFTPATLDPHSGTTCARWHCGGVEGCTSKRFREGLRSSHLLRACLARHKRYLIVPPSTALQGI